MRLRIVVGNLYIYSQKHTQVESIIIICDASDALKSHTILWDSKQDLKNFFIK